jgi:predicted ATP-grasp superfamily ATP-dependent carboligase
MFHYRAMHIAGGPVVGIEFDSAVPTLLFQVGRYSFVHGTLGAIRSLGRAGVPVHASVGDRLVPHSFSRYLAGQFRAPIDAGGDRRGILNHLLDYGRSVQGPMILVPTDDEAAVFAAAHRHELSPTFILPAVPPDLPAVLASKRGLFDLCTRHGIPTPATAFARSRADVLALAEDIRYPVIVKNSEPWARITAPAVPSTTNVQSRAELLDMVEDWPANPQVIVQEYIPSELSEAWIVHVYCGSRDGDTVGFTGRKFRSWPPDFGVTTAATALPNEELLALALQFCRAITYRGIADMDWCLDRRDGKYKLVDFNPRLGANFRLFVTEAEIDVARALHLDLSGRPIPISPQRNGRRFRVENLDWASRLSRSGGRYPEPGAVGQTEYAWYAPDDPVPFLVMLLRFGWLVLCRIVAAILAKARSIMGFGSISVHDR